MLRELFLTTDFGRLCFAEGPSSGPPLVLLHGVTRCWQNWNLLAPSFLPRWHLFALDFRGHGQSARCPGAYRVANYIDDGRALVKQVGQPCVIYGHSLGAMVALALAAEMDLHIEAIIVEDPPFETMGSRLQGTAWYQVFDGMHRLLGSDKPVAQLAAELAEIKTTSRDGRQTIRLGDVRDASSLRFTARSLQHLDPAVFTPILAGEWMLGYDLERLLSRVRCPVLVLQGDDQASNGMLVDEDVERMKSALPECLLVRFPGVGHLIHWTATERLVQVVVGFLESVRVAEN